MKAGRVQFTRVEVIKALGIDRGCGFAVENLSPGINIIHGPNGCGKSTLSRVLQKLLWPAAGEVEPGLARATVTGCIEVRDDASIRSYRVELEAGSVTSLVDGRTELVPTGSPELHARYRMPIAELLVDENQEFAREILRQAAGGFDLEQVAVKAGFGAPPVTPRALQSARREAVSEVKGAQQRQEALDRRRTELVSMRSERNEVTRQLNGMKSLRCARDHLVALAHHDALQRQVETFDPRLKSISGHEGEDIKRAENGLREAVERLTAHEEDRRQLGSRMEKIQVTPVLLAADLPGLRGSVDALRGAEEREGQAVERALRSRAGLKQAWGALLDEGQALAARRIDRETLNAADALADQAMAFRAMERDWDASEGRVRSLPAADDTLPSALVLRRGIEALSNWLRCPAPSTASPVTQPSPLTKLGILCGLLSLLSIAASVRLHWGFAAGAVCAIASFLAVIWLSPRKPASEPASVDSAGVHRQTFEGLGLPGPANWTVESVAARLTELLEQLDRRLAQDGANQERAAHARRGEAVREAGVRLRAACDAFHERHGIAVTEPDRTWIRLLVQGIQAWQEAAKTHEEDEALAQAMARELSAACHECRGLFQAAGIELSEVRYDLASAWLKDLEARRRSWMELEENRRVLEERGPRLEGQRARLEAELNGCWARLGLSPGDAVGLTRLLAEAEPFRNAEDALRLATLRVAETQERLGDATPLMDRGLAQIELELAGESQWQEQLRTLTERIAGLEAEVRHASDGDDLSGKLEALGRASANLLAQEERNADLAVGRALVGWLREQARGVLAPGVLARARDLVTRFTNGRLIFEVEETADGPTFLASNAAEARRPVARLSSGERVQLLMAVRLAFLEESEERALPLMLDEVLASSDDERTRLIIQTVVEIARSGRQVFYFTAQGDEVAKWDATLSRAGVGHTFIDLGQVRNRIEAASNPLRPEPRPCAAVPPVDGLSHREYGKRLGVPGVDPWDPELDNLHVWHVIEDPELLRRVLESGIERLGPLERLIRHSGYSLLGASREEVLCTGLAFKAACRAWRMGRGRPVTREVLQEAAGVSEVFRERVIELCASVGGDGRRLVEKLAAGTLRGWREKSTGELKDDLIHRGCIDESEPCSAEQIREAVAATLSREGGLDRVSRATVDRVIGSLPE